MSCNSSDATVEKAKECKDASLSDSIIYKSKETPVNPSVQERNWIVSLKQSTISKRQRILSKKAIHNAMQAKDTELRKIADIKNNVGDGLCPIREENIT